MNINLNNKEIKTLISCMKEATNKSIEILESNKNADLEFENNKLELFGKILDELGITNSENESEVELEKLREESKVCERCGLTKKDKIDIRYYSYAKQTLCDCCVDIFNGNSWGYNKLKELFGAEQAKKMLTAGFNEVPFGFKISTELPPFLGEENNLKNIIQIANELNSKLYDK